MSNTGSHNVMEEVGSTMNNDHHHRHRVWEMIALVLGVVASTGIIGGVLGKAFYVSRDEYTQKLISDSVARTEVAESLSRIQTTLQKQESAFERLTEKVELLKTEVGKQRR